MPPPTSLARLSNLNPAAPEWHPSAARQSSASRTLRAMARAKFQTRHLLSIISHNINGFLGHKASQADKPGRLSKLWHSLRADIVLLQETHLDSPKAALLLNALSSWHCIWNHGKATRSQQAGGGTAILIRKRALSSYGGPINLHEDTICSSGGGRFLRVKLTWKGHKIQLASIYLPNDGKMQIQMIKDQLRAVADGPESSNCNCVWGGDFNFVPDPSRDRLTNGRPSDPSHPDRHAAATWTQLLPHLCDSYRLLHPAKTAYTHYHARGASRLDRVYAAAPSLHILTRRKSFLVRDKEELALPPTRTIGQ